MGTWGPSWLRFVPSPGGGLASSCGWSRFFPGKVCARSGSRRSRGRESIILVRAGLWVLRPPARGCGGPGRPLCPRARGVHVGGTGLGACRGRKGSRGPRWLGTPTCTCLLQGPEQPDAPSCELPAAPDPDPGPFSLLPPRACLPLPMFLVSTTFDIILKRASSHSWPSLYSCALSPSH